MTRPINAHTHRAPDLLKGKAYELQTWYTDGGRRPASATGAMTSKVKGQGRKVGRLGPMLLHVSTPLLQVVNFFLRNLLATYEGIGHLMEVV